MKPGRNDPCSCGSGKKFKHCCAGKAAPRQVTPSRAEIDTLIALYNVGRYVELESRMHVLLGQYPNFGFGWKLLGGTLQMQGKNALFAFQKAADLMPEEADTHYNLAVAQKNAGFLANAAASYRQAIKLKPDFTLAHYHLAIVLQNLGHLNDAAASYRRALAIEPNNAVIHNDLANILINLGQINEAMASYRRAIECKPDYAEAHNNLGNPLKNLGRFDEAIACYRRAVEIKPDFAEAYCNLGAVLRSIGNLSEARTNYRKAQGLGYNGARVCDALMLPAIMGTRQEMLENRAEFERNLDQLIAGKVTLRDPLIDVDETNFYLSYHGLNDRDLQIKTAKFYAQACPSLLYTAPHCHKPKLHASKLRIGFFSRYLYNHSVSLCFSKLIEALSLNTQFEMVLISNHPIDTKIYSGFIGKRVHLPYSIPLAQKMLAALELDILVYLDIGMEPLGYFLAFSRLARVQCVLAGHPVTTGISNMDYFLSTDAMEPADADGHYSEKLVRLPRPPVYFTRPVLPATFKTRMEFGLPEGRHIYLCPMKLQKLHPDFDEAMTRVLQLDASGIVVLFEDHLFANWKTALVNRFEKTVPDDVRERIVFLPWLSNQSDFISAISMADVILDPFHFGIGSTAALTCATGTPLVTKAGEFMRGRVGIWFCKVMDLPECIAEDTESYAQKAVQIASNRPLRDTISAKIVKNSGIIYENMQPVDDLTGLFFTLTNNLEKQA